MRKSEIPALKKVLELEASMVANLISGYDIDATDHGAVENFLRRRISTRGFFAGRYPKVDDVVRAAKENLVQKKQEWLFERIEKEVSERPIEAWADVEATETFIAEITEDLFALKDEDAPSFAARLLIAQVMWRKNKEAFDAGCDEYERGEAGQ